MTRKTIGQAVINVARENDKGISLGSSPQRVKE